MSVAGTQKYMLGIGIFLEKEKEESLSFVEEIG